MKLPVLLRVFLNDKLLEVKQFDQPQIVIGRSGDAQLSLNDEAVSPLHAVIEEREAGYFVSDLGSQTGTFRNGGRILEDQLASGDEMIIGPYKIQFFVGIPKPTAAQPAAPSKPATPPAAHVKQKFDMPAAAPILPRETPREVTTTPAEVAPTASVRQGPTMPAPISNGKKGKTFAPPSEFKDLDKVLRPGKGTVVEVIVAWKERIIGTHHFSGRQNVSIGPDQSCDIVVPLLGVGRRQFNIVRIDSLAHVTVTTEMSGEHIAEDGTTTHFVEIMRQNRARKVAQGYEITVNQGEMVRVGLSGDLLSIYVRYVTETPKPLVAPLLDLTTSEVTGVILSIVVASIFGLYMMVYTPTLIEEQNKLEEPLRKAIVTFKPPVMPKEEPVEEVKVEPVKEKKIVKVKEETKQTPAPTPKSTPDSGKAADIKPNPNPKKEKKVTSVRPGGATKTGQEGASASSEKRDPNKMGLLSVFGAKGTQSKLDQAYSGSGELQGVANSATGYAGSKDDRAGENIGTKLKDTGAGGKGEATVGIAGVGTKGRGTGTFGYGTGGIGQKGRASVALGGQGEEFEPSIDREGIRRVIQANIRAIKSCYERELNQSPDLYGKIVLEWFIEDGGRVTSAKVDSNTMGNANVANCILARLKTWTFPEPPKDVKAQVKYPFVFSAQ